MSKFNLFLCICKSSCGARIRVTIARKMFPSCYNRVLNTAVSVRSECVFHFGYNKLQMSAMSENHQHSNDARSSQMLF